MNTELIQFPNLVDFIKEVEHPEYMRGKQVSPIVRVDPVNMCVEISRTNGGIITQYHYAVGIILGCLSQNDTMASLFVSFFSYTEINEALSVKEELITVAWNKAQAMANQLLMRSNGHIEMRPGRITLPKDRGYLVSHYDSSRFIRDMKILPEPTKFTP